MEAKFKEGQGVTRSIPGTRDRVPVTVVAAYKTLIRGRWPRFVYDIQWPGGLKETSVPEKKLREDCI